MLEPGQPFDLRQSLWTEEDFDSMAWHDVHVHGLAFSPESFELLMDIDYMFAWVNPQPPDKHFTFWMAPCTLVFWNAYGFTAEIQSSLGLEIDCVKREDAGRPRNAKSIRRQKEWRWVFECQEGSFSFHAAGFQQYTRRKPVRAKTQYFSWRDRGGVCFDRASFADKRI